MNRPTIGNSEINPLFIVKCCNSVILCNCSKNPQLDHFQVHELIMRVSKNLADYHVFLEMLSKTEIISMAGKISAMSDAHSYITKCHPFSDDELDFFLQFQNPLEIIANEWYKRRSELGDMGIAMDSIRKRTDNE